MVALDFPNAPSTNQEFDAFKFDGAAWTSSQSGYVDTLPAGSIIEWPAIAPPAGWLLCDGSAVSRTTYAALFSVIGVTYGNGNGTTTFNLPDKRGRVAVGKNGGTFGSLGATGGAESVALDVSQMPSHTHIQDSHNHSQNNHDHGYHRNAAYYASTNVNNWAAVAMLDPYTHGINQGLPGATATNNPTTATNQYTGGGQAHNNLQPYIVTNFIIKTTYGTTNDMSQGAQTVAGYAARLTQVEGQVAPIRSGFYIRQIVSQVDTVGRSFSTSWGLVDAFPSLPTFKAGSKIFANYQIPFRNNDLVWGGAYIEPQISFNGGSSWFSCGSSGFDGNVMDESAQSIGTYVSTLFIDPALQGVTTDFTPRFRFYVRAYSGTVLWNSDHDLNNVSGTATNLTGNNLYQHYAKIITQELATGQG